MRVFKGEKIPIKSWCMDPESGAIDQAKNLSALPFAFKHIALMPDTHQGFGMPIGGVLATKDVIIPNAVGVDIGCGMLAVRTTLTNLSVEDLKKILGGDKDYHGGIRTEIPVGFSHHSKKQDEKLMPWRDNSEMNLKNLPIVCEEYQSALKQIGTLGGGNHFIEIQKDSFDRVWVMIHSGSRNIGYKVAEHYDKVAKALNEKWHTGVAPSWDLAFLPINSEEGQCYLNEMRYCVEFALANRKLMIEKIKEVIIGFIQQRDGKLDKHPDKYFEDEVNIAHNYATIEDHYGENVWVHRKGATLAREGTIGIIPGSQGTSSYIVKGKGNPESFNSCSHGAGRRMSRKKATETLNLEEEQKKMDEKGILHSIRGKKDLDEAASAYKDIDVVMKEQEDLVEILVSLSPLAVVKG